jgi:hypothetical protein
MIILLAFAGAVMFGPWGFLAGWFIGAWIVYNE